MLGTGKSFRTARDADAVRRGCERAMLRGQATCRPEASSSRARSDARARGTRKSYTVNGNGVRYAGISEGCAS